MPSKVDEDLLEDAPPSISDPYAILEVAPDATDDAIKKAYRKAALKHHPDKVADADKAAAHATFQRIAFAYGILSDARRRRRYDATGRTEDVLDLDDDDFDWRDFYRELYAKAVSEEAVARFAKEYKGSEEERDAVLKAYERHRGAMRGVYEEVLLSNPLDDEERLRGIIEAAIAEGSVPGYDKFTKETAKSKKARMDKARREAGEAEQLAGELKAKAKAKEKKSSGDMGGLAALIQQRQQARAGNFLERLEEKYAKPAKGKKRGAPEEPPEEMFAKNAKKAEAKESSTSEKKAKRSKS